MKTETDCQDRAATRAAQKRAYGATWLGLCGLLLLLAPLALSGCGGGEGGAEEPGEVSYTIVNGSGTPIEDVMISGPSKSLAPRSVLQAGESARLTDPELDVPSRIKIRWTDGAGASQYTEVDLVKALGADYSGPVRVTIHSGGNVSASR